MLVEISKSVPWEEAATPPAWGVGDAGGLRRAEKVGKRREWERELTRETKELLGNHLGWGHECIRASGEGHLSSWCAQ